ncbi:MAG: metallophosphoesterase [Gammaproteobacteria bacterium]|nr:metallophosphoesterase [Gammaproteobacteria bacterium]
MKNQRFTNRRNFLKLSAISTSILALTGGAYSLNRGIRFPMLGLEPSPLPNEFWSHNGNLGLSSKDIIKLPESSDQLLCFRAFSPEPKFEISAQMQEQLHIRVNNISPEAELVTEDKGVIIGEQRSGINRTVTLALDPEVKTSIEWKLPFSNDFTFASIGDSGGDKELDWCIERAHQLGAKFLLHLGDFNYQAGDYERSVKSFQDSPIPCYISIGNHDFHEDGHIYPQFLNELGPLNHSFIIGKTRFVNLDTAANHFPYGAGNRGELVENLIVENKGIVDTVVYTHRPLHDPQENSTHDIGSDGEHDWLVEAMGKLECKTMLAGHIHIYDRSEYMGIDHIIAGQGLGHQDILTKSDYSKMVIGRVDKTGKLSFDTEPLSMPFELHCHPRSKSAKDARAQLDPKQENTRFIDGIDEACTT